MAAGVHMHLVMLTRQQLGTEKHPALRGVSVRKAYTTLDTIALVVLLLKLVEMAPPRCSG